MKSTQKCGQIFYYNITNIHIKMWTNILHLQYGKITKHKTSKN